MTPSDLAQVLFASTLQPSDLQPSDELSADRIRAAIDARLCACGGDPALCAGYVAQEAGDHPETFAARMRWALGAAALVFPAYQLAA